jgi:transposase
LRPGRPPKLVRRQLAQLPRLLTRGAEAHGFSTALWITQRVADLLWKRFQVRYDRDHVCRRPQIIRSFFHACPLSF